MLELPDWLSTAWTIVCVVGMIVAMTYAVWRSRSKSSGGGEKSAPSKKELQARQAAKYVLRAWEAHEAGEISEENFRRRLQQVADVPVIAQRTSILDGEECEECRRLDGACAVMFSSEHRSIEPPNGCDHESRECKCMMSYIMGAEVAHNPEMVRAAFEQGIFYPDDG